MEFKLGEFVRFVEEKREGYITKIFNDQMIGVTGEDDFEIPVLASKVTRVHGHVYKGVDNQATEDKLISASEFKTTGIYLAVVPDTSKGSVVYFNLVNDTSYQLLSTLGTEENGLIKGSYAGIIAPASTTKVYSASLAELGNWPKFYIKALFYSSFETKEKEPLNYNIRFSAKHFSGAKKSIKNLSDPGWLLQLDEEEVIIDPEKLKESFFRSTEEKKLLEQPSNEVDLHIEKIRSDSEFLNKDEILKIQLVHFQKSLDAAIVHKLPSIIFIHGVGNGTLRYEIQKIVSKHPQVRTYMDARKEKYGYGATEVIFK